MNNPDSNEMDAPKPDDAPEQENPAKPADSAPIRPRPRARWSRGRKVLVVLAVFFVVLFVATTGSIYHYIVTGGMIARQKPAAAETLIATWLVDLSIPKDVKALKNPLRSSPGSRDVAAGREMYQKNCQICHGDDGSGKTEAGGGLYPPPLDLTHAAIVKRKRTDGELFYFIRNGIRNSGMPGWQLSDQETWQLVSFIRNLPVTVSADGQAPADAGAKSIGAAHYVGSSSCKSCHADLYDRWSKTLMANVVRDPHEHPDAIIPDLSKPDPLVTFAAADVAFVYGSKWKQRYFKKVGDDYYVFPAQWDVTHKKWKPYVVKDDWWVSHYPASNFQRPSTSALCDGCHSVNFNTTTRTVTEWNVGCEKCHGPGSEHVKNPVSATIVDPSRLDYVQSNDTCIQCHSQGRPVTNPIAGKYYDWPVGFNVGARLSEFWRLEEHKIGETSFTHFADGTAHKNRMQGNDYVTSLMYTHGVACFTCHDSHGSDNPSLLRKPATALCLDCHGPKSSNGPHAPTIEQHTHHKVDSAGSECIACHMPKIAQTIGDVNVRSHTFRFVYPARTDGMKIPNACNVCHTDKSTAWTADALKNWTDRSPWRVAE